MTIEILDLREVDLDDAARLVCDRYRSLRRQEPLLPERYENFEAFLPGLARLVEAAPGVAATEAGRLAGFMTGYLLPEFLGVPSAYSPEWANGTVVEDSRRIYEEMYAHLSARWVERGYFTHALTMFAHDRVGLETFQWLAFGYAGVDGLRELSALESDQAQVAVRRAGEGDYAVVEQLLAALENHIAAAPVFWPHELEDSRSWLGDPHNAMWLAVQDGEILGCLGIGPANREACTIIRDEGTASIISAYTREDARSRGVAAALLDQALSWAREQGFTRCAVDFEAMNSLARRFWLKWFRPVCYSLIRSLNEEAFRDKP
jgi:GNAT superfamily N-acetyltransferase